MRCAISLRLLRLAGVLLFLAAALTPLGFGVRHCYFYIRSAAPGDKERGRPDVRRFGSSDKNRGGRGAWQPWRTRHIGRLGRRRWHRQGCPGDSRQWVRPLNRPFARVAQAAPQPYGVAELFIPGWQVVRLARRLALGNG